LLRFDDFFGKTAGIAYAYTEVDLPGSGDYILKIGSNDGIACRLNGEWIYSNLQVGRLLRLDEDKIAVKLNAGKNQILLKVPNLGGDWEVCLRICDAKSNPLDLTRFEQPVF